MRPGPCLARGLIAGRARPPPRYNITPWTYRVTRSQFQWFEVRKQQQVRPSQDGSQWLLLLRCAAMAAALARRRTIAERRPCTPLQPLGTPAPPVARHGRVGPLALWPAHAGADTPLHRWLVHCAAAAGPDLHRHPAAARVWIPAQQGAGLAGAEHGGWAAVHGGHDCHAAQVG